MFAKEGKAKQSESGKTKLPKKSVKAVIDTQKVLAKEATGMHRKNQYHFLLR